MLRWCTCLALSSALWAPGLAQADPGPSAGADDCGTVRFVGVMGSGDHGQNHNYGREMGELSDRVKDALPDWVDFKSSSIDYPAYSTDLLVHREFGTYADGVRQGDQALADFMHAVEENCPDELEILAGYSSGAMVVHDFLDDAAFSDHWTDRIIGVHLLADPRRSPTDSTNKGNASLLSWGITSIGQWPTGLPGTADVPSVFAPITKSWCATKDPVCATDALLFYNFVANSWRHVSYGITIFPDVFISEAARLTKDFRYRFPPRPQILPRVAAGWPVNISLKGDFPYGVRFTSISPAIPGLKLSPTGMLSGVVPQIGLYNADVTAETAVGGATTFTIFLDVVEPFDMVDYDQAAVTLPPLVIHQPTGILIPSIPARAVVTLEPDDALPAGLALSPTGRLSGRPDVAGDTTVGVRVAQADGTLRRFQLELSVINPAKLVSSTADGTPSDSATYQGLLIDHTRAAFVSAASNLGVDNPDNNGVLYVKDVDSGALAHWVPPTDEYVCGLETDPAKTTLYVSTTWWEDFTNQNGDPDSREHTTIRQISLAGTPGSDGAGLVAAPATTYLGSCNNGAALAPAALGGPTVISGNRLDLPGQPYGTADPPDRVYRRQPDGSFTRLPLPESDALPWFPKAIADIRSDGAILVKHQRTINTSEPGPQDTETGYFLLTSAGAWRRVDVDAAGEAIPILSPRFYAGGLVFSMTRPAAAPPTAVAARAAAAGGDSGVLRTKPIAPADPAPFDSLDLDTTRGIVPLTGNDYAVGCSTYKRNKPTRVEPMVVYYDSHQINACVTTPFDNSVSPFSAGADATMLVSGPVGEAGEQLLVADIP
jgi:cutinase